MTAGGGGLAGRYREMLVTNVLPLTSAHGFFPAYHMLPLALLGINTIIWRNPHRENASYPTTHR